jgi:hypothetical protein
MLIRQTNNYNTESSTPFQVKTLINQKIYVDCLHHAKLRGHAEVFEMYSQFIAKADQVLRGLSPTQESLNEVRYLRSQLEDARKTLNSQNCHP